MFSKNKLPSANEEEADSSESEDDLLPTPRKRSGGSKAASSSGAGRRPRPILLEDDDDDDVYVTSSIVQRGKPPPDSDEESDEPIQSPLKRRRPMTLQADVSSESDLEISPAKRRRKAPKPVDESEVELEEDEEEDSDLPSPTKLSSRSKAGSTSAPGTPTRYTRQKKEKKRHRSEREKALELAKRRRAGDKSELTPSDSESEDREDSNLEHLSDFEDDDEESFVEPKAKPAYRSSKTAAFLDIDPVVDEEDDFIVEDDEEGLIGVDLSIPLEFTSKNHQKPKEHFKYAVEWLVHKKLNPGFASNDEIYYRAFQMLDNKPRTLAQSKYGSSVWTADFWRTLNARPNFRERKLARGEGLMHQGVDKCEVCNRTKHPSTYAIRFEGKAYHKDSLDEVEQDDAEEENEEEEGDSSSEESGSLSPVNPKDKGKGPAIDDDARSVDVNGNSLPPESREWYSGQFCFRKAQTAHLLIHWKYELYQWVLDTLEREGELKPAKIVKRDKMKAKERRDYANKVVDRWARKGGQIDDLWRDYDAQIKLAEEAQVGGRWG